MFLDEIASRIVLEGAGVLGVDLFLSSKVNIPPGDGPFTSIIETGGTAPRRTHNNTATQRPSAQILVRASTYPSARARAQQVYDALGGDNGLYNLSLLGTFYQQITSVQNLTDLGLDELARVRIVFNINVEKVPS
jgi:hypothetical protein